MSEVDTYHLDPVDGMVALENIAEQQEEQMADLSTPISDLLGPSDPQVIQKPSPVLEPVASSTKKKRQSGLTPEQMDAVIAGIAAIVAFSGPVQSKLSDIVPGTDTLIKMLASALVAAIVFFFGKRFLSKRQ